MKHDIKLLRIKKKKLQDIQIAAANPQQHLRSEHQAYDLGLKKMLSQAFLCPFLCSLSRSEYFHHLHSAFNFVNVYILHKSSSYPYLHKKKFWLAAVKEVYKKQQEASCHQAHSQDKALICLCRENHDCRNYWEGLLPHNSIPWWLIFCELSIDIQEWTSVKIKGQKKKGQAITLTNSKPWMHDTGSSIRLCIHRRRAHAIRKPLIY